MGTITLENVRASSDITVKVRLKDGGIYVAWTSLSDVKAYIYSDAQRAMAGRCDISVDGNDDTLLICNYAATKPQYIGVNSLVVRGTYDGRTKTYDRRAFNIVPRTFEASGTVVLQDPVVDLELEVTDVSSSILDAALAACIKATEEAKDIVDVHRGPQGEKGDKGDTGDTGAAAGFGTIAATIGMGPDPGPAVYVTATGPNTAKDITFAFVNLKGDKGDQGDQGTPGEQGPAGVKGDKGDKGDTGPAGPKGDQGNSGYSGAAGELEVVNNLTDGGATAALSAEMGKQLGLMITGAPLDVCDVNEDGLFFVDTNLLVGAKITSAGFTATNSITIEDE